MLGSSRTEAGDGQPNERKKLPRKAITRQDGRIAIMPRRIICCGDASLYRVPTGVLEFNCQGPPTPIETGFARLVRLVVSNTAAVARKNGLGATVLKRSVSKREYRCERDSYTGNPKALMRPYGL